jgi:hypothetical protein
MAQHVGRDYFDAYSGKYAGAAQRGEWEVALLHAAKGYLIAVELGDNTSKMAFAELVHTSVRELLQGDREVERDAVRCSFCGETQEHANLLLGAAGAICEKCARSVFRHFGTG